MPKVVYRPVEGGPFVAPQLSPGAVLEVSTGEAEHLISTGVFERYNPKPEPEEPVAEAEKSAARPRKETKHA